MGINFDCIHSILENHQDVEKPFQYPNNDNSIIYFEYIIYGNKITFPVKNKIPTSMECEKYCHIIEESEFNFVLDENLNKLKKILDNYDNCIIKINGCDFEKEECKKNVS
ncbi:hypothetical protein [uncultured Brachyspira sp.]|uniref:hypothetical protein n=1 Tax=uncultured Brachyspira sp. TaxID=221953 RepID=UPI0025E59F68|nr:hypothetical protein [uncultured Brachyspira sp.]